MGRQVLLQTGDVLEDLGAPGAGVGVGAGDAVDAADDAGGDVLAEILTHVHLVVAGGAAVGVDAHLLAVAAGVEHQMVPLLLLLLLLLLVSVAIKQQ